MLYQRNHKFFRSFVALFLVFAFLFQPIAPVVASEVCTKIAELVSKVGKADGHLKTIKTIDKVCTEVEEWLSKQVSEKIAGLADDDEDKIKYKNLINAGAKETLDLLTTVIGSIKVLAPLKTALSGIKTLRKNSAKLIKQSEETTKARKEAEAAKNADKMDYDAKDAKDVGDSAKDMATKQDNLQKAGEKLQALSIVMDGLLTVCNIVLDVMNLIPPLNGSSIKLAVAGIISIFTVAKEEIRMAGESFVEMSKSGKTSDAQFLKLMAMKNLKDGPSMLLNVWGTMKKGFGVDSAGKDAFKEKFGNSKMNKISDVSSATFTNKVVNPLIEEGLGNGTKGQIAKGAFAAGIQAADDGAKALLKDSGVEDYWTSGYNYSLKDGYKAVGNGLSSWAEKKN